jgi:hypothetical protein
MTFTLINIATDAIVIGIIKLIVWTYVTTVSCSIAICICIVIKSWTCIITVT